MKIFEQLTGSLKEGRTEASGIGTRARVSPTGRTERLGQLAESACCRGFFVIDFSTEHPLLPRK